KACSQPARRRPSSRPPIPEKRLATTLTTPTPSYGRRSRKSLQNRACATGADETDGPVYPALISSDKRTLVGWDKLQRSQQPPGGQHDPATPPRQVAADRDRPPRLRRQRPRQTRRPLHLARHPDPGRGRLLPRRRLADRHRRTVRPERLAH